MNIKWLLQYDEDRGFRVYINYVKKNNMIYGNYVGYAGGGTYEDWCFKYDLNTKEITTGTETEWFNDDDIYDEVSEEEYRLLNEAYNRKFEIEFDSEAYPSFVNENDLKELRKIEENGLIFTHSEDFDLSILPKFSKVWGLLTSWNENDIK